MTEHSDVLDIKERLRRIETRLTKFMDFCGFDTQTRPPKWNESGAVDIPSMGCSIKDIMRVVPDDWQHREIHVYHKGAHVARFIGGNYNAAQTNENRSKIGGVGQT